MQEYTGFYLYISHAYDSDAYGDGVFVLRRQVKTEYC